MDNHALGDLALKIEIAIDGRRRGDEIVFRCPNPGAHKHGDSHPSARWNSAKRVWNCPVCGLGGGAADLARRLGLELPRPTQASGPERPPGVPATWKGAPLVGLWTYRAADGKTLGHVARFQKGSEPKQIIPFFGREADSWKAGAAPAPRPLYNLDRIMAASLDVPVWVVEGEKSADALTRLGAVATTSPGGALAASQADWSPLAGRRVTIWPDCDSPGARYCRDVQAALARLSPPVSVELINVAKLALPEGGDVYDWLQSHPRATLADIEKLPRLPRPRPDIEIFDAATLAQKELPEPAWVVPSLVPEGLTLLAGRPKMGKSFFALMLARAVALGGRALGTIPCERGAALYLALEDTPQRLKTRLAMLADEDHAPAPANLFLATRWPRLDHDGAGKIRAWCEEYERRHAGVPLRLVVVDTLGRLRGERQAGADWYLQDSAVGAELQALAQDIHAGVLVLTHLRKAEAADAIDQVQGSNGLAGACDGIMILTRTRGELDARLFVTGRDAEEQDLGLSFSGGIWRILGDGPTLALSRERREILAAIEKAGGGPVATADIATIAGKPRDSVKRLLFTMQGDGQVQSLGRGGWIKKISHFDHCVHCDHQDHRDHRASDHGDRPLKETITGQVSVYKAENANGDQSDRSDRCQHTDRQVGEL